MKPRKHQYEAMQIVDEIVSGSSIKDFIFMVTPGGGKSALPIIFGKLIELGLADSLAWICPRKTLQYQGESAFMDPFFQRMFGHRLRIRVSTNDENPCRGLNGFITTYQAIGEDKHQTVLREIQSRRYVLVLDEYHHAEEDSIWEAALTPIVDVAKFVVKMTGTIERHSGRKVAFTQYKDNRPDLRANDTRVVTYTRSDALAEKAIIPYHFTFTDASVEWREASGQVKKYRSMKNVPFLETGKAIFTALNTEYAEGLMSKGLSHYTEHKKENHQAKMLVVAANIASAQEAMTYLRTKWVYSDIATSADSDAAQEAINKFRNGYIDILVGVGMFYEGFDCKEVSHIVSLTNIRSTPWIEQMLARSARVSPHLPYGQQYGYIFTMDDPRMNDIVTKLKTEQLPFIKNSRPRKAQLSLFDIGNEGEGKPNPYDIDPLQSSITEEHQLILGKHWPQGSIMNEPLDFSPGLDETPSDKERRLRKEIDRVVNRFCAEFKYKQQVANYEIKMYFGKGRSEMTLDELQRCLEYVNRTYVPRGTGRRRTIKREPKRFFGIREN